MEIWLTQDNNKFRLPVLPPSIELVSGNKNTSVNITNLGEVNIIGKRSLDTVSFSSFFPSKKYGFVQYLDFPKPLECKRLIDSFMSDPVRLTITGTGINMLVTIETFTHSFQDGTKDMYYTIELKQYINPNKASQKSTSINLNTTKIEKATTSRSSKLVKSTTYTVKQGDTLYQISQRLTGTFDNWRAIANQNNITDPKNLKIGTKLVIKV